MAIDIERLKTINYFQGLDTAELEEIKKILTEKTAEKGEMLFFEGQYYDYIYFLVSGVVKVYKSSVSGKEQIMHIATPGDSFNDISTFDGEPSSASMVAMTPVHLYRIYNDDLKGLLPGNPRLCLNIMKTLANRVRRDCSLAEELTSGQVLARLARLLMGKYAGEESNIGQYLTQQDMASFIGTRREVINRGLKVLEDKGGIMMTRRGIEVINKKLLAELAQEPECGAQSFSSTPSNRKPETLS
jgi:CRP/FNR family transcriptional regulator